MIIIQYQSGYVERHDTERSAIETIACRFPGSYLGDWENGGEGTERRLVWRYESDSMDDSGSRAMAQMIREVTT